MGRIDLKRALDRHTLCSIFIGLAIWGFHSLTPFDDIFSEHVLLSEQRSSQHLLGDLLGILWKMAAAESSEKPRGIYLSVSSSTLKQRLRNAR